MAKERQNFNKELINGKFPITYQDMQEEVENFRNPAIARAIPEKYMKPIEERIQDINLNYGLDITIPNISLLITNEQLQYGICKCFVAKEGDYDAELKEILNFDFKSIEYYIQRSIERYRVAKKTRLKRERQKLAWTFLLQVLEHYRKGQIGIGTFKFKK